MKNSYSGVLELPIEPRSTADQERLDAALARIVAEDPSFRAHTDPANKKTILKGTSEDHLGDKLDILQRSYEIEVNVGAPQVAYRETITQPRTVDYTHKKHGAGAWQFARVKLTVAPAAAGAGNSFESRIVGGVLPKDYVAGVEKGIDLALASGGPAGFPVIDVHSELVDGAYHDADSSVMAFEIAGSAALREALQGAGPVLLEPVMEIEVITPEEFLGPIIGDINSRRARITSADTRGDAQVINAMVPLANMFGYSTALRSMSDGRARFSIQFDHYQEAPRDDDPPFQPATGMRA